MFKSQTSEFFSVDPFRVQ